MFGGHSKKTMFLISVVVFDGRMPPQDGWIKINVDASFLSFRNGSSRGRAGRYACEVRSPSGCLLDYWANIISYVRDAEEVELMAIYYAIHNAIRVHYLYIELEGNCLWVVQKITRQKDIPPKYNIYIGKFF